ncbi:MAG TPA: Asp-tRNA(Asn)/Glu-tRNA(Gln) amidotransferase subunit GatA [bacterium]|jgi:aspartyl-tRNA(Asn)/glutamyl-tRNA(Gln) amidotransferase subunit A|nr:Asp-tRNA(Asn)/Glu-tRNA(Gln) amidotransferase subunit GatA [bacterium]
MELFQKTIHEIAADLKAKKVSSVELTKATMAHLKAVEPKVQSFITITEEVALAQAAEADKRLASGSNVTALTGVPLGIKDLLCTKGVQTTCASKMLEGFKPPYDATVVERLNAAGAIMVGKTNMDEFAMGSSTESSYYKKTKNPWNLSCVPGGSSGGSASCVSADQAFASLGSDTGGSIRQPAALCGIVGLKPTYGRVSRYGLIAFASSLDQIGPMTKDVEDCALMMNAIAGHDPKDSTSANVAVPDYLVEMKKSIKGLKIGIPKEFFPEGMNPEVTEATKKAIDQLKSLGAEVHEISLPHSPYSLAAYYVLAPSEASSNLARYDGVRYGLRVPGENIVEMYSKTRAAGFGPEVKRRIMLGTYALSSGYYDAYYLKALKVRRLIKQDYDKAFEKVDIIVTPTVPNPAFKFGEKTDNPLTMYLEDVFTISINIAGVPGLSLPCGLSKTGLPIGLQMIGKPFDEATLLKAAYAYEQSTDWHKRKPSLKEN